MHFWLEQNSKALGATIQALEVQKMTLATLKGMNYSMADLAEALKLKPGPAAAAPAPAAEPPQPSAAPKARKPAAKAKAKDAEAAPGVVDPMQWWGSLTQQFQHIAANAMQDVAERTAATTRGASGEAAAAGKPARKAAPRKAAGRARG